MGHNAMPFNTIGNYNCSFGTYALFTNTTGSSNTAIGHNSMNANSTGTSNSALGDTSGYDITTGTANTIIGYNTGRGITTGNYNTILGANVTGLSATIANNIIIADGQGNRRINVDSSGNVGIGTTSPSLKLDVRGAFNIGGGSEGIRLGDVGDNASYDNVKLYYTGYNSGNPRIYLTPRTQPGSGTVNTYFHLLSNTAGGPGANTIGLLVDGNVGIGTTSPSQKLHVVGTAYSDTDFRAPIFYDSNDTAYYVDPASTSVLNAVRTRNTYGERVTVTAASSTTIDTQYNLTELTLAATITTLTLSNIQASSIVHMWTIVTVGGGVGYSITWPAAIKWPGGTAPTLTTASSKRDIYQFVTYDGGTNIYAIIVGQNL
jgi:hypothetical protein